MIEWARKYTIDRELLAQQDIEDIRRLYGDEWVDQRWTELMDMGKEDVTWWDLLPPAA